MAMITFPSGTNHQIFIQYLEGRGLLDWRDDEVELFVPETILDTDQSIVDKVFDLGGVISARHGY